MELPGNTTTIIDLIRFCHTFVHNTMRFKSPSPLAENKTLQEQFALLAQHVIKDSLLEKHMMRPLFETALHNDGAQVNSMPSVDETKALTDKWVVVGFPE